MKKHGEFQQDEQQIVLSERDNLQLLKEFEERSRSTDSKFSRLGRRIIFLWKLCLVREDWLLQASPFSTYYLPVGMVAWKLVGKGYAHIIYRLLANIN